MKLLNRLIIQKDRITAINKRSVLCFVMLFSVIVFNSNAQSKHDFVKRKGRSLVVGDNNKQVFLRGISLNFSTEASDKEYQEIKELGGNTARVSLRYEGDIQNVFNLLDRHINYAKNHGLWIVPVLMYPPGGFQPNKLFADEELKQQLVEFWGKLAEKYANEPVIAAYNLINEPLASEEYGGMEVYQDVINRIIAEIRIYDKNHLIDIENRHRGTKKPETTWPIVSDENVMYDFHEYQPHFFTHQGVRTSFPEGTPYPSEKFNRDSLYKHISMWGEWGIKHNYPVMISEFGVEKRAVSYGGNQWVNDAIDIFSEYNMNFIYFDLNWKRVGKDFSMQPEIKRVFKEKMLDLKQ